MHIKAGKLQHIATVLIPSGEVDASGNVGHGYVTNGYHPVQIFTDQERRELTGYGAALDNSVMIRTRPIPGLSENNRIQLSSLIYSIEKISHLRGRAMDITLKEIR